MKTIKMYMASAVGISTLTTAAVLLKVTKVLRKRIATWGEEG